MKTERLQGSILPHIEQDNSIATGSKTTPVQPEADIQQAVSQRPVTIDKRESQAAEITQQGNTRAAELRAQLEKPGADQKDQQNIIAILIG